MTKIVFFGTPEFVTPIPQAISETKNAQLVAVVTNPDKPVGRKQILTPSPVKSWAQNKQIKVIESQNSEKLIAEIEAIKPELGVLAAFGKIIPQKVIDLFPKGILVVHPSLLPKYRGASPIQTALVNGDQKTGLSIIQMDSQMDHGPIVAQEEAEVLPTDTAQSLYNRFFARSAQMLKELLPDYIEGKIQPQDQDHSAATYTSILQKVDGHFELNNPPDKEKLERMIRAYYPWPNVWTNWNGKIVKFYPDGLVQMEGKNKVKLEDFLNGYPDFPIKEI